MIRVNAVDAETTPERLKKYMADMKLVVDLFHKCFPETSILIVSSPDRGSKTSPDGTMKGVEMLVGYQEQLAAVAMSASIIFSVLWVVQVRDAHRR